MFQALNEKHSQRREEWLNEKLVKQLLIAFEIIHQKAEEEHPYLGLQFFVC